MKDITMKKMKKILFLFSSFCLIANQPASFIEKAKGFGHNTMQIIKTLPQSGKNFLQYAKENKIRTLQGLVVLSNMYAVGKPDIKNFNPICTDKNNHFSGAENKLLYIGIKAIPKIGDSTAEKIKDKGIRPITYIQNVLGANQCASLIIMLEALIKFIEYQNK
jgi:hypothetical protein